MSRGRTQCRPRPRGRRGSLAGRSSCPPACGSCPSIGRRSPSPLCTHTTMAHWPRAKLLAASSLPLMSCSGWKSWRYVPVRTSSTTVGSKSRNTQRGTCFLAFVSLKNVMKASSPPPTCPLSHGMLPSACINIDPSI